jgi:hypothetical protein
MTRFTVADMVARTTAATLVLRVMFAEQPDERFERHDH